MRATISTPKITELLDTLYADAAARDPLAHEEARKSGAADAGGAVFYKAMGGAYMAIGPDFGHLLYSVARTARAKTIVEFGTSFGVSTIYLAAAIHDNGGGRVITTEFEPEKARQAQRNLAAAGLEEYVEIRVGDALETLAPSPAVIDMLFLDGPKQLYIEVLRLLEPRLPSGGIVASDNTDHDGMAAFLEYIRNPDNGYTSAAILTEGHRGKPHEITVRN